MTTIDLVKNKILYFDEALKVLDETIDYKGKDTTGIPIPPEFSNHYAMDCEMVWVDRGLLPSSGSYPVDDLRKPYPFREKEFTDYLAKLKASPPTNRPKDDTVDSLIEYMDWSVADVTILRDAIKGEANAQKIRDARKANIDEIKTKLSRYVLTVARITIVNWNGFVIYDKLIKHSNKHVVWCPPSSGIPNNFYTQLSSNPPPETITIPGKIVNVATDTIMFGPARHEFKNYISTSGIMIGHNLLGSDYYSMLFKQSNINYLKQTTRDTAYLFGYEFFVDKKYKINNLKIKNLVKGFLKKDIQMGTGHDPSEDARGALAIYKLFRDGIEGNTKMNITESCPLYPKITDQHSAKNDPDGTKLLEVIITDLLRNLSQIHTDIKDTLKDTDEDFLKGVRDKYIEYLKYLLS